MISDSVKLKIVNFLLKYNVKIGRKLSYYRARFTAGQEVREITREQMLDRRKMDGRMKNIMIHDQDIIDKRWAECEKCEFLKTKEKMGKEYSRCQKCGCFMKIGDTFVKIKVATSSCPLNPPKWDKEYEFIKGKPTNGTQPIVK